MKIGIYAAMENGEVKDKNIDYIAVDRGYEHLKKQGIIPLFFIGDNDSNHQIIDDTISYIYPSKKDQSDTQLAIEWAINHQYDEIEIYGVMQGRMDHFLSILHLIENYATIQITLYDQKHQIKQLPKGNYLIDCQNYHYFSIFTSNESIITLKNCLYPLDNYQLSQKDTLILSNECENQLYLETSETILFIQTND